MRNLLVCVCGDSSLHQTWIKNPCNFDTFIVYYGDTKDKYRHDGQYYAVAKGSKFNILHDIYDKNLFNSYDAIFVPDDDLYFTDINRFFDLFHKYDLSLAQPSIFGWVSWPITAHVPMNKLRYTNWVEIMCPCFNKDALSNNLWTFKENKTNWGIEFLWAKDLDKIAIIDEVIAVHTRPCFFGDTYSNNNTSFEVAMQESRELLQKYNLSDEKIVYSTTPTGPKEFADLPSQHKFLPDLPILQDFVKELRCL